MLTRAILMPSLFLEGEKTAQIIALVVGVMSTSTVIVTFIILQLDDPAKAVETKVTAETFTNPATL